MPSFFVFGRRNHFFSEKYARMENRSQKWRTKSLEKERLFPVFGPVEYYEKMKENWKRAKISSKKVPANTCNFRIAAV